MEKKKKLVPTDNKLQIGSSRTLNHYTFMSKIFLNTFDEVELHALG